MIPETEEHTTIQTDTTSVSSPIKSLINQFENRVPTSPNQHQSAPDLFEDFVAPKNYSNPPKKKRTTVIFGTSITKNIDARKLGLKGRRVINISQSGAKIKHIKENVEYFHKINKSAYDVEKIIFSLGTNDVKYSRRGVKHLKRYLIDLINRTKMLFPGAIIMFQCCLPIRNIYWYTAPNVLNFNNLLCSLCQDFNCVYIDCFRDFLDEDGLDYNRYLFYDWLHLNDDGLGVLGSWLKAIINVNSYNYIIT